MYHRLLLKYGCIQNNSRDTVEFRRTDRSDFYEIYLSTWSNHIGSALNHECINFKAWCENQNIILYFTCIAFSYIYDDKIYRTRSNQFPKITTHVPSS